VSQQALLEPHILQQIRDDKDLIAVDRVVAGSLGAGDLRQIDTHPGLEPLPVAVGQGDCGNGCSQQPARHPGDAVEALARRGIEQPKIAQGVKARLLVLDNFTLHLEMPSPTSAVPIPLPARVMPMSGMKPALRCVLTE
jgi:hypothetical protein